MIYLVYNQRVERYDQKPLESTHYTTGRPLGVLENRKLVLILPTDHPSHDLCKVVLSAVALGYPAPIIVNWNKDFNTKGQGIGPSQLGKISGTLDFLDWAVSVDADSSNIQYKLAENDLVLILDAHDVWLQLPPDILLQRYVQVNKAANRRVASLYGPQAPGSVHQTIIVSAQKGCVAPRDSISNLHCDDLPESILPTNVYGPLTDFQLKRWRFVRPRYVNSGSFMGPVGDMRRYFRRVNDTLHEDMLRLGPKDELGGDQGIFAQVFGEQEVWRKEVGKQNALRDPTSVAESQQQLEYHIGLDYSQQLFYPTCYAEYDGYFVQLGDEQAVKAQSSRLGIFTPRAKIPEDVAEIEDPFTQLGNITTPRLGWENLSLYTDFWTSSVPVALHHNAWRNDMKQRRNTWWDKTWYFPYLRLLVEAKINASLSIALANVTMGNRSVQTWAYGSTRYPKVPRVFVKDGREWNLQDISLNNVCRSVDDTMEEQKPWYDEVFRDGEGSL
ncbi:hypothetical protein ACHAQK_007522 [Fusarium lateritium]